MDNASRDELPSSFRNIKESPASEGPVCGDDFCDQNKKMANRCKASEQLSEYAAAQKVRSDCCFVFNAKVDGPFATGPIHG